VLGAVIERKQYEVLDQLGARFRLMLSEGARPEAFTFAAAGRSPLAFLFLAPASFPVRRGVSNFQFPFLTL
jgi:hypothetical protein